MYSHVEPCQRKTWSCVLTLHFQNKYTCFQSCWSSLSIISSLKNWRTIMIWTLLKGINSKKTTCMRIGSNGDPPARVVSLNGSSLTWTQRIKHLGNIITCDLKDSEDITFKKVSLYHRSTGLTAKRLKYLAMLRASCCKHIAVHGMDVKHGISPASLRARWTLNGIKLFAAHCAFLTRRIQICCLCWSKESPLWLNLSPVCQNLYNLLFVQIIPL